jgi:anti-anti-sigma factor
MANKSGEKNLILYMSATRYFDSSGLSAILVANRLCRDAEGALVLCTLQEPVMKLISISQLHNVLHITPTLKEAEELITTDTFED